MQKQESNRTLTKRYVESLKPAAKPVLAFDAVLAGFGIRVMPSGHRSYFVQYRTRGGRSRWLTIGAHGAMTVDAARTIARRALHAVAEGGDPSGERLAFREAPVVGDLLDRYLKEHVQKRNRATMQVEAERLVERHIRPALGRLKVASVTRADVAKLHRSMSETSRQANFALSICSKAFSLAEEWQMRAEGTNPCRRVERYAELHRERFLSADELTRLGATLRLAASKGLPWRVDETKATAKHLPAEKYRRTVYPRVVTAAVELLLYTGCRLSEVLNMRRDQVDLDGGVITLRETKAGKPQTVTINAPARRILKGLLADGGSEWVLPAPTRRGRGKSERGAAQTAAAQPCEPTSRPLTKDAMEAAWQKLRAHCGLADVRLHDLRHTVGTYAGQTGANAFLVRDLLRHSGLAMTGRYVNKADDPVRALNDLVGERIAAGLEGRPSAEVMTLRR